MADLTKKAGYFFLGSAITFLATNVKFYVWDPIKSYVLDPISENATSIIFNALQMEYTNSSYTYMYNNTASSYGTCPASLSFNQDSYCPLSSSNVTSSYNVSSHFNETLKPAMELSSTWNFSYFLQNVPLAIEIYRTARWFWNYWKFRRQREAAAEVQRTAAGDTARLRHQLEEAATHERDALVARETELNAAHAHALEEAHHVAETEVARLATEHEQALVALRYQFEAACTARDIAQARIATLEEAQRTAAIRVTELGRQLEATTQRAEEGERTIQAQVEALQAQAVAQAAMVAERALEIQAQSAQRIEEARMSALIPIGTNDSAWRQAFFTCKSTGIDLHGMEDPMNSAHRQALVVKCGTIATLCMLHDDSSGGNLKGYVKSPSSLI